MKNADFAFHSARTSGEKDGLLICKHRKSFITHARPLLMAAATGVLFSGNAAWSAGTIETIALSGQAAAGGGTFADFDAPLINDAGQLVFTARVEGDIPAVFVYDPLASDAALQQVARQGQDAPETTISAGGGAGQYASFSNPLISHQDRVAFQAGLRAGASGPGIYMPAGPSPFMTHGIVSRGDWAPMLWQYDELTLQGLSGAEGEFTRLLFTARLEVPEDVRNDSGIYLVPNAIFPGAIEFAMEGEQETPGGDRFDDLYDGSQAAMNANGLVVFSAQLRSSRNNTAIYAGSWPYSRTRLVREGDAAPGGGIFPDLLGVHFSVNDSGQLAFSAQTEFPHFGIYRLSSGESPELVIRSETAAPVTGGGEDGTFRGLQRELVLNNEGQVAFVSQLNETSNGSNNDSGIFRAGTGGTVAIAREDQAIADVGEFDSMGMYVNHLNFNNDGIAVFFAYLRAVGAVRMEDNEDEGIFIGRDGEIEVVVREGHHLGDSTRTVHVLGGRCLSTGALNDDGQIAFWARLDGGDEGIFLYTPEASYGDPEPAAGGARRPWDSPRDWRSGRLPKANQGVRLSAKQDLTIDGPKKQTTISNLSLDATENAKMNLRLAEGPLVVTKALDIKPRASIEVLGLLEARGKATNSGKIFNHGGTVLAKGGMTNTESGAIMGSGVFHWPKGLTNEGRIELTNSSTLIGPVRHERGVLVVRKGASAVFLGDLAASGGFKGPGEVAFASRLGIGTKQSSITRVAFEGDVRFGQDASLDIELGGTKPGQFDALYIGGKAVLDGTLAVRQVSKYSPKVGDRFKILTANQITGEFAKVTAPQLPKGLSFDVSRQKSSIVLIVTDNKRQDQKQAD